MKPAGVPVAVWGILLGLTCEFSALGQAAVQPLVTNGPTASRINIVFLSEGYTSNELSKFEVDARVMLESLLSTPPFLGYSNFFNAFAISVPSNESGSDHYTPVVSLVDTYFNSRYDSSEIQRFITIDDVGRSRLYDLLYQFMPEYDIVVLVVNDLQLGGSGGIPIVASIHPQSGEILAHEVGHGFAGLADEYSYSGDVPREAPNATMFTNLSEIRWNVWIPPETPIPTPATQTYLEVVGLYQGAVYSERYYRPKQNCRMRELGVPFCEVCAETLIKAIHLRLNVIESFSPAVSPLPVLTNSLSGCFSVSPLAPETGPLTIQWFTNGVPIPGATSAVYAVSGFELPQGTNEVQVRVADPTPLVRNDPTGLLIETLTWQVDAQVVSPALSLSASSDAVTVAWPETAAGFRLEQSTPPSLPLEWMPLVQVTNAGALELPATGPGGFFRLHRP